MVSGEGSLGGFALDLLGGEDIAEEDLVDLVGRDLGHTLKSTWESLVAGFPSQGGVLIAPLIAWEPNWVALRLESELHVGHG